HGSSPTAGEGAEEGKRQKSKVKELFSARSASALLPFEVCLSPSRWVGLLPNPLNQGGRIMEKKLDGKRVAILVADGFEQVELTGPKEALEEAGAETQIVSPNEGTVAGE